MEADEWRRRTVARQAAYLEGVNNMNLLLVALDNDPARVAAYKELMRQGEVEAARLALYGTKQ